jgi:hypothetical protein
MVEVENFGARASVGLLLISEYRGRGFAAATNCASQANETGSE